uniref:Uncharacterized protein n=1 Tax=Micrurus lemniscatus lemniscatus TaxID=129467 RepID=A0A2D4JK28_MICLE
MKLWFHSKSQHYVHTSKTSERIHSNSTTQHTQSSQYTKIQVSKVMVLINLCLSAFSLMDKYINKLDLQQRVMQHLETIGLPFIQKNKSSMKTKLNFMIKMERLKKTHENNQQYLQRNKIHKGRKEKPNNTLSF